MELKRFTEHIADQFNDIDASEITADTVFKDLDEWSSLTALSFIAMVDEEYDVTLKGDDIRKANTIKDLFNIVASK
ncbi:MAG: acyl carrier protein [Bacteroidales bacterium]|nr:acyl carrier protein [Bacteroidales bacterium]